MQGDGYWINSITGEAFLIDEHARWISQRENAEKIGLPPSLFEMMRGKSWQHDRVDIVLAAMEGRLIRMRDHREFTAFEYTIEDIPALQAICNFLDSIHCAGPFTRLRINNLRDAMGIVISWDGLKKAANNDIDSLNNMCKRSRDLKYASTP